MPPCTLENLRELASTGFSREDFSPLGSNRTMVVAMGALAQLRLAPDRERIADWLKSLPCPVIAVGPHPKDADLLAACDAVASSEVELSAMRANIDRAPFAAMVLVQTLRATATLPVMEALLVESLAYGTLQAGPEYTAWLRSRKKPKVPQGRDSGPAVWVERSGDTLALRLNRPGRLNAISVEVRDALCDGLQLAISDPAIAAVSMSGEGRCFSIGGDLDEFGSAPDPASAHAVRSVRLPAFLLSRCADRAEFRLHGACIGAGVELPSFARRVTAARDAFFQLPEIRYGLIPGAGGCVSIPRRIGRHRTAYLALSARKIGAAKALQWGLIDALSD
ncbi:MAG TPA: enoyl-CoA hydratase/isomerase family protein [Alphaproteobacteria bacterium]|nr:enoyl-CoA hydratase/isomerase family protein [Alphaproteobacteria bacterium]